MPGIAIIGAQWGDEGKGKVVDVLAREADYVIRYQGGANAGHTVVAEGKVFKLNLLPSGVIHPHAVNVLGDGLTPRPWSRSGPTSSSPTTSTWKAATTSWAPRGAASVPPTPTGQEGWGSGLGTFWTRPP